MYSDRRSSARRCSASLACFLTSDLRKFLVIALLALGPGDHELIVVVSAEPDAALAAVVVRVIRVVHEQAGHPAASFLVPIPFPLAEDLLVGLVVHPLVQLALR